MLPKRCGLVILLGLCGCVTSSGFNRNLLEERLHVEAAKVTDDVIKQIQTLKPQLHFPCRIAVALRAGSGDWRWTAKDRQVMEGWAKELRQQGIASDVIFMSAMFMQGDTLRDLRASAAKYGADALLVIKGTAATDSWMNPAALFNLTVVGGFVVPGSHRDSLFLLEGGVVDVNNAFLYASMQAEGEGHTVAPTFIIEEKDAIERAKQQALTAFGPELLLRLRNLRSFCAPPMPPVALDH
jgi:rhombotail lipoprotein